MTAEDKAPFIVLEKEAKIKYEKEKKEYELAFPDSQLTKKGGKKPVDESGIIAPKRAWSPFFFYQHDRLQSLKKENVGKSHKEIVSILGTEWRGLSDESKQPYISKSKVDQKRYEEEKKEYTEKIAKYNKNKAVEETKTSKKGSKSEKSKKPKSVSKVAVVKPGKVRAKKSKTGDVKADKNKSKPTNKRKPPSAKRESATIKRQKVDETVENVKQSESEHLESLVIPTKDELVLSQSDHEQPDLNTSKSAAKVTVDVTPKLEIQNEPKSEGTQNLLVKAELKMEKPDDNDVADAHMSQNEADEVKQVNSIPSGAKSSPHPSQEESNYHMYKEESDLVQKELVPQKAQIESVKVEQVFNESTPLDGSEDQANGNLTPS